MRRDGRSQIEDVIWPYCVNLCRRLGEVHIDCGTNLFDCDPLVGYEVPERGIIWHHLRMPLSLPEPDPGSAAVLGDERKATDLHTSPMSPQTARAVTMMVKPASDTVPPI